MNSSMIECAFCGAVDIAEAEELIHLAIIAAGGLYSEPRLRTATRYRINPIRGTLQIDTGTPEGESVGHIFLALADRAFEPDAYTLRLLTNESNHDASHSDVAECMEPMV